MRRFGGHKVVLKASKKASVLRSVLGHHKTSLNKKKYIDFLFVLQAFCASQEESGEFGLGPFFGASLPVK